MNTINSAAYAVYQNSLRGIYKGKSQQFTRDLLYAYLADIQKGDSFMFFHIKFGYDSKRAKRHRVQFTREHKKVLKTLHKLLLNKRHFGISLYRTASDLYSFTIRLKTSTGGKIYMPVTVSTSSSTPTPSAQSAELKKLQTQNADLQRKVTQLQKEVNQLKAELAMPNDTSKSLE